MFKSKLILLILLLSMVSCGTKKDLSSQDCDSDNPLEDIPWLKEKAALLITSMIPSGFQIIRYYYHGQYVFLIDDCYNCPDGLIQVFDCEGVVICEFGGHSGINTCPDFETEATDSTMVMDHVQP